MKRSSRAKQAGLSFFSLIFVMVVLASLGVLIAQVVPTAIEYQAIVKAANRAKDNATPVEIRNAFNRSADVDDFKAVAGKDLEIYKEGDRNVVKFAYDKEIHMFGPAYLLLKYGYVAK
jgi:Tfp pilus assembly protein PilE